MLSYDSRELGGVPLALAVKLEQGVLQGLGRRVSQAQRVLLLFCWVPCPPLWGGREQGRRKLLVLDVQQEFHPQICDGTGEEQNDLTGSFSNSRRLTGVIWYFQTLIAAAFLSILRTASVMSHTAQGCKGQGEAAPNVSFTAFFKGTNPGRLIAVTPLRRGGASFALFPQSQESCSCVYRRLNFFVLKVWSAF